MAELTIITNNVPRDEVEGYELTAKERKEFDYIDWDKIESGEDSASFIRYKGEIYDLGDFQATTDKTLFPEWDGFISESFFSGILIKFTGEEQVIVGRYYT